MNEQTIVIRPWTPEQRDATLTLILGIQQHEYGINIQAADQPDLQDVDTFYRSGQGNFWVATADDRVVGSIALRDIGNQQAALRKMFVDSEYRGAKFGVAAALLKQLLEWAEGHHFREVFLGTTAQFLAAHRFYEKNGFALIEKTALPPSFPIMAVDSRFYCKSLPATE